MLLVAFPVFFLALCLVRCSANSKYLVLGLEEPEQIDHFLGTFLVDSEKADISAESYDTALSLSIKGQNIFGQSKSSLLLFKEATENIYDVISTTLRWSKFDIIRGIIVLSPDIRDYEAAFRRFIAPVEADFIQIYQANGKSFVIVNDIVHPMPGVCSPGKLLKIQSSFDEIQPVALASTLVYKSFAQSVAKQICEETGNHFSHLLFSGNYSFFLASLFPIDLFEKSISRFDLDITAYLIKFLAPHHFEALAKLFPILNEISPMLRIFVPESECVATLTQLGRTDSKVIFERLKSFQTSKATMLHDQCMVSLVSDSENRVPIFYSILSGRIKGIDERILLGPFVYYLHWLACHEETRRHGEDISRADRELTQAINKIDQLIKEHGL